MNIFKERFLNYIRINRVVAILLILSSLFSVFTYAFIYGCGNLSMKNINNSNYDCWLVFSKNINIDEVTKINEIIQKYNVENVFFRVDRQSYSDIPLDVGVMYKNDDLYDVRNNLINIDNSSNKIVINKASADPVDNFIKIGSKIKFLSSEVEVVNMSQYYTIISEKTARENDLKFNILELKLNNNESQETFENLISEINKIHIVGHISHMNSRRVLTSRMKTQLIIYSVLIGAISTISYIFILMYLINLQNKNDYILRLNGLIKTKLKIYKICDLVIFIVFNTILGLLIYDILYKLFLNQYIVEKGVVYEFKDYLILFCAISIIGIVFCSIIILIWNLLRRRNENNL